MKRTLKRELKAREIDIGEALIKVAFLDRNHGITRNKVL